MKTVWIVEHQNSVILETGRKIQDTIVLYVGSTFEKAKQQMIKGLNYGAPETHGGYLIYPEPVDINDQDRMVWFNAEFPSLKNMPLAFFKLDGTQVVQREW